MGYYIAKVAITSVLVVLISETAKRSTFFGAVLASIPVTSVLALLWIYGETKSIEKISALATSVFWLVIPSLAFFLALPMLLKQGLNFFLSLSIASLITIGCYFLMISVLNYLGIKL